MADVDARNHQHNGHNGTHEGRQRLRETPTARGGERPHRVRDQRRRRLRRGPAPAAHLHVEPVQFRRCFARSDARAESAKEHQHPREPSLFRFRRRPKPRLDGHPEVGPQRSAYAGEFAWRDTDDRVRIRPGLDDPTQDVRATIEVALPDGIADHGNRLTVVLEPASQRRPDAEDVSVGSADDLSSDELAVTVDHQVGLHGERRRDGTKRLSA
jgi:hypothetical protein